MSISLILRPGVRVGGETLHGEVELHFPQVQEDEIEEVHVEFRGSVNAKTASQVSHQYVEYQEKIEIVHEDVTIWTRASAYPPPETNLLTLPFQFHLPIDSLPSAHYQGWYKSGTVRYTVEAVGVRKRPSQVNRRVKHVFAVLPADPAGFQDLLLLKAGWTGPWSLTEKTRQLRRGLWGEYSTAKVQVKMPKLDALPLFTNIPVTIHVMTTTKSMKRGDSEGRDTKERLFPCPPLDPKEIGFHLRRRIRLSARGWHEEGNENISPLGGLGKTEAAEEQVNFRVGEKRWMPSEDDKTKGCWMQESTVDTTIHLTSSPSFSTRVMSIEYVLRIRIDFPGITNNVEIDIPVKLTSAMVPPTDSRTPEGSNVFQAAPPYEGGSPVLDLPPSYWVASDWDVEEKKSGSDKK